MPTAESEGCAVTRITLEHDIMSEAGLAYALKAAATPHCTLWISMPCTGGSKFSSLNWGKGNGARLKIFQHIRLFYAMLPRVLQVARACRKAGGVICFEQPGGCYYWDTQVVRDFLDELGLTHVHLHCCQFGLVSTRMGPCEGLPIQKHFCVATNSQNIADRIGFMCPRTHEHARLGGRIR